MTGKLKGGLRRLLQSLGLYEAAGVWIARVRGLARGVRIERAPNGDYRVKDGKARVIILNRRHAIYLNDMVVFFDFFFEAVLPDSSGEVHYEKPAWHSVPGCDRPVFFNSYAESGVTLDLYQQLAATLPGDTVIDIGAYCGLTSIDFARRVGPTGHVYAFEPDPESFAAFQKNHESFGLPNLTLEQAAIWKDSGLLEFQTDGTAGSCVSDVSSRHDSTVQVKSITLSDYAESRALARIDVIKIDAEGAEIDILRSSRSVLRRFRPALIVELHLVRDRMTTEACRAILEEEGYDTRIVSQPGTVFPLMAAVPREKTPRDGNHRQAPAEAA